MKIAVLLLSVIFLASCKKEKCISCVAESASGKLVEHRIACDKSNSYINGFKDGLVKKYKEQGDTVVVSCKYN